MKAGDIRRVKKFAWLPQKLDNGETVWLQSWTLVQEWYVTHNNYACTLPKFVRALATNIGRVGLQWSEYDEMEA
jgi:hypothetical protein